MTKIRHLQKKKSYPRIQLEWRITLADGSTYEELIGISDSAESRNFWQNLLYRRRMLLAEFPGATSIQVRRARAEEWVDITNQSYHWGKAKALTSKIYKHKPKCPHCGKELP